MSTFDRPRRVKIIEPGWENFTGEFGPANFEDGVSIFPLSPVHVDRVAAELRVVDADDEAGGQIGPQVRLIEAKCVSLDVLDRLETAENEPELPLVAPEPPPPPEPEKLWTKDELFNVADKDGIKGLRAIGDPLGAKGRAIPELIEDILTAQDARIRAVEGRLSREG